MIVVSNTSPLTNLAAIGHFDLLRSLYGQIHIPSGVWMELNRNSVAWPGSCQVATSDWVVIHTVQNRSLVQALQRDLDLGESECIALALEMQADLALLDEREARRAAQRQGIRVAGVLAILLSAKAQGYLATVKSSLDDLRTKAGFYLSDRLYRHTLDLADE